MAKKSITVDQLVGELGSELKITVVSGKSVIGRKRLTRIGPNRPGMVLTGFWGYFEPQRLQILGRTEYTYLKNLNTKKRQEILKKLLSFRIPALIVARGLKPFPFLLTEARRRSIPILVTPLGTNRIVGRMTDYLEEALAEEVRLHGTLVDVYGVGILIQGESGVGKSECALELVRGGHRLVADDLVHVKKVTDSLLLGYADKTIQHHMEIRGLGIIDVEKIFGIAAVRRRKHIELLAELRPWSKNQSYDRTGLRPHSKKVLSVSLPYLVLPVRPGRNLSVILEVAAINYRMSVMGVDTPKAFNKKAVAKMRRA